jgi:hypothetical protein
MKRYGVFSGVWVGDGMKTQLKFSISKSSRDTRGNQVERKGVKIRETNRISHIAHFSRSVRYTRRLRQRSFQSGEVGYSESRLTNLPFQDLQIISTNTGALDLATKKYLHQTMRIGMIVHRTLLPWCPNQKQQVEDAWNFTHQIPRVLFVRVGVCVFRPV